MATDSHSDPSPATETRPDPAKTGPTHEEVLAARTPVQESQQPDPILQMSVGRVGPGGVTLAAAVAAAILAVVLYGLNSPGPTTQDVGPPPATSTAPAAGGGAGPALPGPPNTHNTGHS